MKRRVILITGTRKGIGRFLADYYLEKGDFVVGCSRGEASIKSNHYLHFELNISDEDRVKAAFREIRSRLGSIDTLINNAGIASMNHSLLTPNKVVQSVLATNVTGLYLVTREAAKLMMRGGGGNIVNFSTVAVPLRLEGEAIYAASKAAVVSLTHVLSKELIEWNIRVNAVGPTPVDTDLIKGVPKNKIEELIKKQTIRRLGRFEDITNVIDFLIHPNSSFITGQVIYLGGVV